jgi:competence protein ComEA
MQKRATPRTRRSLREAMQPVREFIHHRLGFTRSEIAIVGLLCAGLMTGTAVRMFRQTPAGQRVFPYATTDSAFAQGVRAFHTARQPQAEPGTASSPVRSVDINSATAPELIALPGIGPAMAARIIAYRTAHGRFGRIEELDRVKGIGPATLKKLQPFIRCSSSVLHH